MSVENYAVIDGSGNVVNVILLDLAAQAKLDDEEKFAIANHTIVSIGTSGATIGWTYSNGTFTAPSSQQGLTDKERLVFQAIVELQKSDVVAVRCLKAGVAFPSNWQTFVTALRAIANGTDTTSISLPTTPAFPPGT